MSSFTERFLRSCLYKDMSVVVTVSAVDQKLLGRLLDQTRVDLNPPGRHPPLHQACYMGETPKLATQLYTVANMNGIVSYNG